MHEGCQCVAHRYYSEDIGKNSWVCDLIEIPVRLNTFWEKKVVDLVFNRILIQEQVHVEKLSPGNLRGDIHPRGGGCHRYNQI